jgi:hypothetical protein
LIDGFGCQLLDLIAADPHPLLAGGDVLDGKDVRGATAHQLHAFPGQIAHGTLFRRQDGAGWQNSQSQQVRKVTGIGFVTAVFQSFVFLDRCGVGQMHFEPRRLQAINQPVPVEGRFDDNAGHLFPPGQEQSDDLRQVVGQSLFRHDPVFFIRHGHHAVVRMQVNSAIFHFRPPMVKASSQTHFNPAAIPLKSCGGGRPAR